MESSAIVGESSAAGTKRVSFELVGRFSSLQARPEHASRSGLPLECSGRPKKVLAKTRPESVAWNRKADVTENGRQVCIMTYSNTTQKGKPELGCCAFFDAPGMISGDGLEERG